MEHAENKRAFHGDRPHQVGKREKDQSRLPVHLEDFILWQIALGKVVGSGMRDTLQKVLWMCQ